MWLVMKGDQVHLPDEVAQGGVHVIRATIRAVNPDPDLQLGHPLEVACFVGRHQLVQLLRRLLARLEPAYGGADQRERADALRVREGEIYDGPCSNRASCEERALDTEVVEQPAQVVVVGEGEVRWRLRAATTPHVVADHAVALTERLELTVPHPAVGDPGVDEDERLPVAADVVVERGAVHLRESAFRYYCVSHPRKYARRMPSVL